METTSTETGEILDITVNPGIVRNSLTRVRVAKHFPTPSLAKQSFAEECNINNIMRKYEKSGIIEHLNNTKGEYGNFIGYESYQVSLNQILEAQESFATIPSRIRSEFNNDPAKFLEFAQNPENLDQMIEMGLAPPRPLEAATGKEDPNEPGLPLEPDPGPGAAALAAEAGQKTKKKPSETKA